MVRRRAARPAHTGWRGHHTALGRLPDAGRALDLADLAEVRPGDLERRPILRGRVAHVVPLGARGADHRVARRRHRGRGAGCSRLACHGACRSPIGRRREALGNEYRAGPAAFVRAGEVIHGCHCSVDHHVLLLDVGIARENANRGACHFIFPFLEQGFMPHVSRFAARFCAVALLAGSGIAGCVRTGRGSGGGQGCGHRAAVVGDRRGADRSQRDDRPDRDGRVLRRRDQSRRR